MIAYAERLFSLVTQRPDRSLKRRFDVACPVCNSKKVRCSKSYETTAAFGNHTWDETHCLICSEVFVVEARNLEVWYTKDGKILKGFPNCFEEYIYTCSKCGADVKRQCYNKSDNQTAASTSYYSQPDGSWYGGQYYRYDCVACDAHVLINL